MMPSFTNSYKKKPRDDGAEQTVDLSKHVSFLSLDLYSLSLVCGRMCYKVDPKERKPPERSKCALTWT